MAAPLPQGRPVEVRAPQGARVLELVWDDGASTLYRHVLLRGFCPCAHCQGHAGPISWVKAADTLSQEALELTSLGEVGQYAIGLSWGDGHSTGIYSFNYLRRLALLHDQPPERIRQLSLAK